MRRTGCKQPLQLGTPERKKKMKYIYIYIKCLVRMRRGRWGKKTIFFVGYVPAALPLQLGTRAQKKKKRFCWVDVSEQANAEQQYCSTLLGRSCRFEKGPFRGASPLAPQCIRRGPSNTDPSTFLFRLRAHMWYTPVQKKMAATEF